MQPPPNQPTYQPPIPAPDVRQTSAGYVPPPGPPEVNFDVVGRAWETLKPNLALWVIAFLIYTGITFGISFMVSILGGDFNSNPNLPVMVVGNALQFFIGQFLMAGLYRMAINQVRGQIPTLGDMFSVTDVLPTIIMTSILTTIAMIVGFLFCIIPGLILAGLFLFVMPLVVDKRMDTMGAISASIEALKPQLGMAILFTIVIGLLAGAGMMLCGVGILISGPLALLSIATLYRDFFPQPAMA